MSPNVRPFLILAFLAVALFAWMARYDLSATSSYMFQLDRWTGSVVVCGVSGCGKL